MNSDLELIRQAKSGSIEARNELFIKHLAFVREFCRTRKNGCERDDLVHECFFGFIRAIDRFDERKNVKFLSFARWWLVDAITKAKARGRLIYVPLVQIHKQKSGQLPRQTAWCVEHALKRPRELGRHEG